MKLFFKIFICVKIMYFWFWRVFGVGGCEYCMFNKYFGDYYYFGKYEYNRLD